MSLWSHRYEILHGDCWLAHSVPPIEYNPAEGIKNELVEIEISADSQAAGKPVVELALLKDVLIVLMSRGDQLIVPSDSTVVVSGDTLLVLSEKDPISAMRMQFSQRRWVSMK